MIRAIDSGPAWLCAAWVASSVVVWAAWEIVAWWRRKS